MCINNEIIRYVLARAHIRHSWSACAPSPPSHHFRSGIAGEDVMDPQPCAHACPQCWCELGASVSHDSTRHAKTFLPVGNEGIHARARATQQKLVPHSGKPGPQGFVSQNGGSFTSLLTGCWWWFSWSSILIKRVLCRGYHMLRPANDLLTAVGIRLIY
jgi:hypothetical protein